MRRYRFGESLDSIGKLIGSSGGAVKVRLSRLRKKLRGFLISTYADAEELLAKYPADRIFEVYTFIKVDPSQTEPDNTDANDNRNP